MNENEPSEPPSTRSAGSSSAGASSDDDGPGRERVAGAPSLLVDVSDATGGLDAAVYDGLVSRVRTVLGHTGASGEVRVEVVGDDAMAKAHKEYLDADGTTDVMTFDLMGGASAPPPEGESAPLDVDIMVCVDEAGRQAGELGHALEDEMTLYVLHGVLHCLGYDDTSEDEFARMHAEEDRLLTAAGLGALFSRAEHPGGER